MKNHQLATFCFFLIAVLMGCGPSEEELASQVASSVLETVEAIPTVTPYPTLTPFPEPPTSTPYPTPTPFPEPSPYPTFTPFPTPTPAAASLENLYCNFGFCIGYPQDPFLSVPEYAVDFLQDIGGEINDIDEGGYDWLTEDVIVYLDWYARLSGSLRERVENALDDPDFSDVGQVTEATINNIDVAYAPYKANDSSLPYRLFSAWRCGDRLFTYSIRSENDVDLMPVLERAVTSFVCSDGSG